MSAVALSDIVTEKQAEALASVGVTTTEQLAAAHSAELAAAKGLGEKSAERLIEKAQQRLAEPLEPVTGNEAELPEPSSGTEAARHGGAPLRPPPGPRLHPLADLRPGCLVYYHALGAKKPWPAIVVEVTDPATGEITCVAHHEPTSGPGGVRSPTSFHRATPASDQGSPEGGSWTWPD